MSWIAWKKVFSPTKSGGLRIGSLQASNLAMLTKWWWRFHTKTNSLWRQVITSIYGEFGSLNLADPTVSRLRQCPWKSIISLQKILSRMNINLYTVFIKHVKDGSTCLFWYDIWYGTHDFKSFFPRLYSLESQKACKVNDRCIGAFRNWAWRRQPNDGSELEQLNTLEDLVRDFVPSSFADTWSCSLDASNTYQVRFLRKVIDEFLLCSNTNVIRWNKTIPIKVNIHSWRLRNDRLPTRINLDLCGIEFDSTRCPLCDEGLEDVQHLFVDCPLAARLWSMVKIWWRLDDYPKTLLDLISWGDSVALDKQYKTCFDAVVQTTLWIIWRYRNRVCFNLKPPRQDTLVEEIKILSHSWVLTRNRKFKLIWLDWIDNPIKACTILL